MFGPLFAVHCFVSFSFCNHLYGKERASCCTLIVFLMSFDCKVFVTLLRGAVGWSAVCNWGIS